MGGDDFILITKHHHEHVLIFYNYLSPVTYLKHVTTLDKGRTKSANDKTNYAP